jgi:hypothetical protein
MAFAGKWMELEIIHAKQSKSDSERQGSHFFFSYVECRVNKSRHKNSRETIRKQEGSGDREMMIREIMKVIMIKVCFMHV